jgi:hypothetical protein
MRLAVADLTTLDLLRHYAQRIEAAAHGAKADVLAEACERLQVSRATLYKRFGALGLSKDRKTRSDAGTSSVPESTAKLAAGIVHTATRANNKRTITIDHAARLINANGYGAIDGATGEVVPVAPSTLARAMRLYNCHPDQLATPNAHTPMRSLYPNHVWQADCSVCVLFYAPDGGLRVKVIDETDVYKNKPEAVARVGRALCLRWAIADHTSQAFYSAYQAGAEDAAGFNEFFIQAIQQRTGQPFYGVPKILVLDPGAAARAQTSKILLERLGVQVIIHRTKNPRAKGSVEGLHNLIEREFEGRLSFWRPADLAALNACHENWRVAYCAMETHSRHGMSRFGNWIRIREDQLLLAPPVDVCRELATTRPVERTVSGELSISYVCPGLRSMTYSLRHIPGVAPKQKVRVVVNAYRIPDVDILVDAPDGSTATYTVSPVVLDENGFNEVGAVWGESFKRASKSDAERSNDEIAQMAYGLPSAEDARRQRSHRTAFAGEGSVTINPFADIEQMQVPAYMPRRGREHSVAIAARDLPNVALVEAVRRLRAAGARSADLYSRLAAEFPDGFVTAERLTEELEMLRSGPQQATG